MLIDLSIENYALINKLEINFSRGLSIITGETGAGKSILLGAFSLILGSRADVAALKDKDKNCVVEGVFNIEGYDMQSFFNDNGIEPESQITLRRIISPLGKSRAFINDTPVNLNTLKEAGDHLIDIHSQHQNLLLSTSSFQLSVVDAVAKTGNALQAYEMSYKEFKDIEKYLALTIEQNLKAQADYDYIKFQFEQLELAKLKTGETEQLEAEVNKLSDVENLKQAYEKVSALMSDDEISVKNMMRESFQTLGKLSKHTPSVEISQRLESCLIEIRDIASDVENIKESLVNDPERLAYAESRLGLIYDLQNKHKVKTIDQLIDIQDKLGSQIIGADNFESQIKVLTSKLEKTKTEMQQKAALLTDLRKKALPGIEGHVTEILKSLGMPNAVFTISMSSTDKYEVKGCDNLVFKFSANKDSEPQEISKVASGGEMSRLMLSLKSLLVKSIKLPSIVFDEIDTGISGETADKTGDIIKKLSEGTQVINITHLPQIAAKANQHYIVYKEDTPKGTFTNVKLLSESERVDEIAKMLSGSVITEAAREHAKNLIG